MEVILLFSEHDFTVPAHFRKKSGCGVFVYTDRRDDTSYIPSIRPWLLWQYLVEDPAREQETYFYIDSDIIFREWIDFATLDIGDNKVVGSDCSGYISHNYVSKCTNGEAICTKMAEICGITVEQMKDVPGIGAHLILRNPTAAFWERCYQDSNKLHHYFETVDSNVQKWTAEMWVQLWGWVREGFSVSAADELNFCLPTDDVSRYDEVKILHNAGVLVDKSYEYFFKGQYVNYAPFGRNFDHVRRDKATIRYVEAVQQVIISA